MKKLFLVLFLSSIFMVDLSAQSKRLPDNTSEQSDSDTSSKPIPEWRKRLTFGGNFGASFGYFTFVDVSPLIGYRFTERFTAGLGGTYIYLSQRISQHYPGRISTSIYGGRSFAQFVVIPSVFLHGEYEALSMGREMTGLNERKWIGNPLIGAGYRSKIGQRSYFQMMALYNLNFRNNSQYSSYRSPIVIRIGFQF